MKILDLRAFLVNEIRNHTVQSLLPDLWVARCSYKSNLCSTRDSNKVPPKIYFILVVRVKSLNRRQGRFNICLQFKLILRRVSNTAADRKTQ